MAITQSESSLASQCFQWAWNQYPKTRYCLFHIPNEAKRSFRLAATQKAQGLIAGVPDYTFVWNGQTYFLELKTKTTKLSEKQLHIHQTWKEQNVIVEVAHSFEDFQNWFNRCIKK